MLINHPSTGTFLFDTNTCHLATMPKIRHQEKPISLFVPTADDGGGSLYIMRTIPRPESGSSTLSYQFEVLMFSSLTMTFPSQPADCRRLPPPPYICDLDYDYPYRPRITAYAVVGSSIYISAQSVGTYCLDTLSNTWHRVGQWTLPFLGKVEYVPELSLWFGISEHGHLAAADLSA